jgi:DNA-binding MarR family transcriptional regulator
MNRVLDSLRSFQVAQAAAYHRASDAVGVPETSLIALQTLRSVNDGAGVPMKDLAREIGVSPAVLTGVVDRLEERGWIRRQLSPTDRRSTVVVPTVDDDSDIISVLRALDEPLRKVANSIPDSTAAVVRQLVGAMVDELRAYEPEESETKASRAKAS